MIPTRNIIKYSILFVRVIYIQNVDAIIQFNALKFFKFFSISYEIILRERKDCIQNHFVRNFFLLHYLENFCNILEEFYLSQCKCITSVSGRFR